MRHLLEGGVYKRVVFISKVKKEENEIIRQFKALRYFLNHAVRNYNLKMQNMAFLPINDAFSK